MPHGALKRPGYMYRLQPNATSNSKDKTRLSFYADPLKNVSPISDVTCLIGLKFGVRLFKNSSLPLGPT